MLLVEGKPALKLPLQVITSILFGRREAQPPSTLLMLIRDVQQFSILVCPSQDDHNIIINVTVFAKNNHSIQIQRAAKVKKWELCNKHTMMYVIIMVF